MHKNHVTWSRTPSSDNVSAVYIFSEYDKINEDEKNVLPIMLNIYAEKLAVSDRYEKKKKILIGTIVTCLILSWVYLAILSST